MTHSRSRLARLSLFVLLALLALWGIWTVQNDAGGISPDEIALSQAEETQEEGSRATEPEGERMLLNDPQATGKREQNPESAPAPGIELTLVGRVHHAGQGVASAAVHLVHGSRYRQPTDKPKPLATARTDAQGRFQLTYQSTGLSSASMFALAAQAEGYTPAEELVIYGTRSFTGLDLELFTNCEVNGVVVDAQSRTVENADVRAGIAWSYAPSRLAKQAGLAYRPMPQAEVATDKRGRFQMVLPSQKDWSVVAAAEAGRCELFRPASAERRVELRLQLVKPKAAVKVRVWGYVRDQNGALCSDVDVKMREGWDWRLRSDDENDQPEELGKFEFNVKVGSDCTLYAGGQGFEVRAHPLGRVLIDTGPVILNLRPGLVIRGQLVGADGKAMARALVNLTGDPLLPFNRVPPVTLLSGFGKVRALTDAQGRFEFGALAKQEYWVHHREENAPYGVAMAKVMAGSHDVRLQIGVVQGPAAEIRGRLLDALTGAPIAGSLMSAWRLATYMRYDSGSYGVASALTDAQGLFVFRGLEPAEYELKHSARGYAPSRIAARFYQAGNHVTQLLAYPTRNLSVRVLDLLGRPVHRARVYAIDRQGKNLMISIGGGMWGSPAFTDKQGQLNMHRLPAQKLTLKVEPTMWQESLEHSVVLVAAQTQVIDLKLKVIPGGEPRLLKMPLHDREGKPVKLGQGCDVILEDIQGRRFTGIPIRRDKKGRLAATVGASWIDKIVKDSVLRLSVPRTAFRVRVAVAGYQELVLPFTAGKQAISKQATLILR